MQTRKNRKNDETSYEKMLKLRYVVDQKITKSPEFTDCFPISDEI